MRKAVIPMRKANDGFTLIELLVGILCATIITGAAMSLLLMGTRTNRSLTDANSEQQTARIITSMVEMLASEGDIGAIETVGDSNTGNEDWTIFDKSGTVPVLYYSAAADAIRTRDGSNLMTGVTKSSVTLSDSEDTITGCLLNFSLETAGGTYENAVFCRTAAIKADELHLTADEDSVGINNSPINTTESRFALLKILCEQYGSTGEIRGPKNPGDYSYFSEWYIDGYGTNKPDWNENTPWCACFLSWAVAQLPGETLNKTPLFANVTNGWSKASDNFKYTALRKDYPIPQPGDFIFFSWDNDSSTLEHVGAVFATDPTWVYTIEGNSSGTVALRRYLHDDTSIIGYGILDWAS